MLAIIFAQLNNLRLAKGLPSLGYLNLLLYANPTCFNDVFDGFINAGTTGFSTLADCPGQVFLSTFLRWSLLCTGWDHPTLPAWQRSPKFCLRTTWFFSSPFWVEMTVFYIWDFSCILYLWIKQFNDRCLDFGLWWPVTNLLPKITH